MKQEHNTVNPKAGTLKQTKTSIQILSKMPMRTMALIVLLNLVVAQLGFSQGDDSIANNFSYAEPASQMSANIVCCTEDKPVSRKSSVKVDLPSARMIRKADHEVTMNMIHSLHVNRVKEFGTWMEIADQNMNAFFTSETTIGRTGQEMVRTADEDMNLIFAAEHIRPINADQLLRTEEELNLVFLAENGALNHHYMDQAAADATVDAQFTVDNVGISMSPEYTAKADQEINHNMSQDNLARTAVAKVSRKK